MQVELKDLAGKVKGTIELPLEEIRASLASTESSKTEVQLKEGQDKEAELEGRKSVVDKVAAWVDTQVIAEMVVDHLKAQGLPVTFEKAKEVWLDTLQMLGGHLAELKEKLAEGDGRTMDDFSPIEKAEFVIAWGKGLSPEEKATFAEVMEIPIAKATEAEVADGKTDPEYYRQFGCRYCEHLVTVSAPRKPWIGGCRYKLTFPACGKWEIWSGMFGKAKAKVAEEEPKAQAEEDPKIIKGRTDKPGYKYVELCDISIKE